jgi:hypothetical protein
MNGDMKEQFVVKSHPLIFNLSFISEKTSTPIHQVVNLAGSQITHQMEYITCHVLFTLFAFGCA